VAPNGRVKKGDVPFRIGSTPNERIVRGLEAPLAGTSASAREIDEERVAATGRIVGAHGAIEQNEARSRDVVARLDAARRRLAQHCTG
jgi:multidrug resistance efflux pump